MFNKKMLLSLASISLFSMSLPSFATIYLGGQIGLSHAGYDMDSIFDHEVEDDSSVARGYIGMQFTTFLGIETGFAGFSDVELPRRFG